MEKKLPQVTEKMEKLLNNRLNIPLLGLVQALSVALYCSLVASFMFYVERTANQPGIVGIILLLILFVFSAAVTGSLVFGIAAYLALKNRIKEALSLLLYTLLSTFGILLVVMLVFLLVLK